PSYMILFFLTSGLFLGWSLGANDASNVFGSAVGSKMITFRRAAIIASLFVILGAVIQGAGASGTLGKLGSVNAIGGSFTVALAAAITVYMMTRLSLPVSTTQAIVGAIIGWNLFTGNRTDASTLTKIVTTWISGPVLGAIFAILLYMLIRRIKRKSGIHLIIFESYIKTGLIIVGAFGAYSLGANNIANVMGVFVPAFSLDDLNLGIFSLSSAQQLFLLGGLAIAAGILTYSKKVMETVGTGIISLSSEAALVVVLAQALVLFIFSSSSLSDLLVKAGLPRIPLVPVSSSQVIVGSVIGIGLYKGAGNINFRILGEIATGWISTPVIAGVLSFFSLFFVKNIFNIDIGTKVVETGLAETVSKPWNVSEVMKYVILAVIAAGIITVVYFYLLERKKKSEFRRSEQRFWKYIK
ncbi:MAG TPA: inorganic phosphate transporter, partial [Bacteroidales bacterium]|nr:inorganic phosphate transporter [Bacteroidales bacterium]